MDSLEKYNQCSEVSLINDPFFQDSVLNPTLETTGFWNRFVEQYPEKKEIVDRAQAFFLNLEFKENEPDDALVEASLQQHLAFIKENENKGKPKIVFMRSMAFKVAAVLIPAAILGIFLLNNQDNRVMVATEFGKIDTVALPDQSVVILNANSSIEYKESFNKQNKREIWLKGEAFFDVRHLNKDGANIKDGEQFIVHTQDLEVEVLGTEFNVRQRRGRTEVVLQEGSVKVNPNKKMLEPVLLKPGEMLSFNGATNEFDKSNVDAKNYTAWKEKKLILNDPTVNEIILYLEDNFGKKIILENPEMGSMKVVGPIRLNNVNDALFILSTVLVAEIKEKNNGYIIRKR